MKITRITTSPQDYLDRIYDQNPSWKFLTYQEQKKILDNKCYGHSYFWTKAFINLNYQANDFICNAKPLQQAWAHENNIFFNESNWFLEIAYEQIKKEKPDIVFVDDITSFPSFWIEKIRNDFSFIKTLIAWCGIDFNDDKIFKPFHYTLTNVIEVEQKLLQTGHQAFLMNHAFSNEVLLRIQKTTTQKYPMTFIGSLHPLFHQKREKIIFELLKNIEMSIFTANQVSADDYIQYYLKKFLYSNRKYLLPFMQSDRLKSLKNFLNKSDGPLKPVRWKIAKKLQPAVYALEMYQTLEKSKMTFNIHPDFSIKTANNMRLYEATGVGTCLVTDWKQNLKSLFDPENEVVSYKSTEECIEKVKWLHNHPEQLTKIALAGQKKTLRTHTWENRAEHFIEIVKKFESTN